MQPTATSTYYLAVDGQKNNTWVQVSLAGLGKTSRLSFSMTTTDMGDWGANTPMYFALDALTVNTNPLTAVPSVNSHNTNQQTRLISQHNNIFILRNQELFTLDGRKVH
jgi:hypothetical protein